MVNPEIQRKNKRLALICGAVAVFMLGFSALMIPMYDWMAVKMGLNGKISQVLCQGDSPQIDYSRNILVVFTTTEAAYTPVIFKPLTAKIMVHPGELKTVYFLLQNPTSHALNLRATPSIVPGEIAMYYRPAVDLVPVQNFLPNDQMRLPLTFRLAANIPAAAQMVVNYTIFDVDKHGVKPQYLIARDVANSH